MLSSVISVLSVIWSETTFNAEYAERAEIIGFSPPTLRSLR